MRFRPATPADEDALKSLLPDGEITDPSQLPDSVPSCLVDVVPELKVDGEVVSSGSAMVLGKEMDFGFTVTQRGVGSDTSVSPVAAGSYLAVAVAGGTVSPAKLEGLQARIESTKAKLESGDDQQLATLTRGDLLGDLFHSGTLAYFGQLDALSRLQTRQQAAQINLAPSAGTYGYTPEVTELFGTPNSIEPGGVTMDLDQIARTLGGAPDAETRARINTQVGALSSALEHGVPEQMFSTDAQRAEGVSAVKALAIANREGQRIYEITPANRDTALPQIGHSQPVMDEIRTALNAGKTVTTHTSSISVPGWQGAGYVIQDSATGSAAWKIGGGANGGFLEIVENLSKEIILNAADIDVRVGSLVKFLAKSVSLLGFVIDTISVVSNATLNVFQKVAKIVISLGAALATSSLTAAAVAAFAGASVGSLVLLSALIAVTIGLVAKLISLIVSDLLSWFRLRRESDGFRDVINA